ncbi:MAG: hypothetical protein AAGE59_33675 [Cyanobacteria bacterium P01_F01_bin.86]
MAFADNPRSTVAKTLQISADSLFGVNSASSMANYHLVVYAIRKPGFLLVGHTQMFRLSISRTTRNLHGEEERNHGCLEKRQMACEAWLSPASLIDALNAYWVNGLGPLLSSVLGPANRSCGVNAPSSLLEVSAEAHGLNFKGGNFCAQ